MRNVDKIKNPKFKITVAVDGEDVTTSVEIKDNKEFCHFMVDWYIKLGLSILKEMKLTDKVKAWIVAKWTRYIARDLLGEEHKDLLEL